MLKMQHCLLHLLRYLAINTMTVRFHLEYFGLCSYLGITDGRCDGTLCEALQIGACRCTVYCTSRDVHMQQAVEWNGTGWDGT